jgi:hypothetical protein
MLVNFIAAFGSGKFPVMNEQEIASASADRRAQAEAGKDYRLWMRGRAQSDSWAPRSLAVTIQ